jgi:hypothetical protein
VLCRETEEPLQTTPEIRALADVRLGLRIVPAEQENSRRWRHSGEERGVLGRNELEALGKHKLIVEGIYD